MNLTVVLNQTLTLGLTLSLFLSLTMSLVNAVSIVIESIPILPLKVARYRQVINPKMPHTTAVPLSFLP